MFNFGHFIAGWDAKADAALDEILLRRGRVVQVNPDGVGGQFCAFVGVDERAGWRGCVKDPKHRAALAHTTEARQVRSGTLPPTTWLMTNTKAY